MLPGCLLHVPPYVIPGSSGHSNVLPTGWAVRKPAAQSWRDVQRYTADGTAISRLLCPACNASYRDMAQKQDAAFGDFMAKREGEEE